MSKFDYDLIVIGGGAAGFVSSKLARGFGKKVAIIEKRKLGGDCTWYGCIPSKSLIKVSQIAHQVKNVKRFGLHPDTEFSLNTEKVMEHVRSIVRKTYNGHAPETFEKIGIDVFFGESRFIDNHKIQLRDKVFSAKYFIISTGSSPFVPAIDGIDTISYFTNETVFDMERLPGSLMVIGGGPIGIELSSAFNRLGVDVHVMETGDRILIREDRELVDILSQKLREEGVTLMTKIKPIRFSRENGRIALTFQDEKNIIKNIESDAVLIAVGRRANVKGLDLEKAGVDYSDKGIKTDDKLRTTSSNIYACGDVVGPYQFSHMAEYQAVIATKNAFLPFKEKIHYRHTAWCTFTDPEISHAGLTEQEAREMYGDNIKVYRYEYRNFDRGKTDLSETGLGKFICDAKGRLIGAHIIGSHAGDLIHEAQIAKSLGIPFYRLHSVIHIYPTYSDIIKQPAKLCYIDRLQNNIFLNILRRVLGNK